MMKCSAAVSRAAWGSQRLAQGSLLMVAFALSACASKPPEPPPAPVKTAFKMYEWNGDGVTGPASVSIFLDQQKAHFYRSGKEVGWTFVATGRSGHKTPSGSFSVLEKTVNKVSNLYGKLVDANGDVVTSDFNAATQEVPEGNQFVPAKMPYFMRLTNDGVGMHVGPIPHPGSPASHGCIRMPRVMAETFFSNVSIGTPVKIYDNAPKEEEIRKAEKVKRGFFLTGN